MKNCLLLLLCFFLAAVALRAQDVQDDEPQGFPFKEGESYRLHADRVNVRATASSEGKVVDNLPIGTEITVEELLTTSFKMGETRARWAKISYMKGGKRQTGYVWSALIALSFLQSGDMIVTFGHNTASKNSEKTGQMRLIRAGKEVAVANFDSSVRWLTNSPAISSLGAKGFSGVKDIFEINYAEDYCGGAMNSEFIFLTEGNKLVHVHASSEGADAPVFASEERTFPDDVGGKPNSLRIKREFGEINDDGEEVINEREDYWLKWDGKALKRATKQ